MIVIVVRVRFWLCVCVGGGGGVKRVEFYEYIDIEYI